MYISSRKEIDNGKTDPLNFKYWKLLLKRYYRFKLKEFKEKQKEIQNYLIPDLENISSDYDDANFIYLNKSKNIVNLLLD